MEAYTLVNKAFGVYKDEVLTQIGVNKEQKVTDAVAAKNIDETPVVDNQVIITGGGDQLCFDTLTGRYFHSDVEAIRRAENDLKQQILLNMFAEQNELYELLGLEPVKIGEALGWNVEHMPDLLFTSHLAGDGRPCLAIGYRLLPKVDYLKF
jgi:hypothetical protein